MHACRENDYLNVSEMDHLSSITPTPSNVERSSRRKAIRQYMQGISVRVFNCKAHQETLQSRSSDAEKDENIDNEKLVIARHDAIVQSGEGDDCVGLPCNKKEDEWYKEGKECDKNGRKERL